MGTSSESSSERRVLALTGTPGVGKSSLVGRLRRRHVTVLPVDDFLDEADVAAGYDVQRHSREVDTDALDRSVRARAVEAEDPVVVEGHLAHYLAVATHALVLRVRPRVLARRLEKRGWPKAKVRENVEAEAIDLILQECVERFGERRTYEVDVTGKRRHEVARIAAEVAHEEPTRLKNVQIGSVNWTGEILRWY